MGLIEKVEKLIQVEQIREEIDQFCIEQYRIKMLGHFDGGWNAYKGFDIMSKSKLRINYAYGAGEYEFTGNFTIELLEFDRDLKIEEVL